MTTKINKQMQKEIREYSKLINMLSLEQIKQLSIYEKEQEKSIKLMEFKLK